MTTPPNRSNTGGDYVIGPNSTTGFLVVNIRTQVNPHDPGDVAKANAIQDEYKIVFSDGYQPKSFKVTDWNMDEPNTLKAKNVKPANEQGLSGRMAARGEASLQKRNIGAWRPA